MQVTVLDGSTFCVCDERGDLGAAATASGFFAADTRFLSRSVLTLDGARPEAVGLEQPAPHLASFLLRGPSGLDVRRDVFVGDCLEETITVENGGGERVEVELALELGSDFADVFAVKRVEYLGAPGTSELAPPRPQRWRPEDAMLEFADEGYPARTLVHLAPAPPEPDGGPARYALGLEPSERWQLVVGVQPLLNGARALDGPELARHLRASRAGVDESLRTWRGSAARLHADWSDLVRTWDRSVEDLSALRMPWPGAGTIPAAGLPWFMTVFGRDTLVTCLQTLTLGPELATSALRALAETQATEDDAERDSEPGKIVHEIRRGKTALAWTDRYYGTSDATPLFLVLLSELWRWTDDDALVAELERPARRALDWIDGPGDRDGDGFVEYLKRAEHGIDNQSWKDSGISMVFRDGSQAHAPIAPVEVQGYVYDAKLRTAELAREVWGDEETAARLEREAAELRERFDRAFWLPEHGWYALGLDREKRPLDALASNMGHLLWSGIVPEARIARVAETLTAGPLWSGWGVRTLAADEAAYDPLVYHNGTVWPHDNSLIAAGLAAVGRRREAALIAHALLESAGFFEHRLPEVFAGFDRDPGRPPTEFPTSARPQAWAAGTPALLVQALLGLRPDRASRTLQAVATDLPEWTSGLELSGVHAFGRRWTVRVESGASIVDPGD